MNPARALGPSVVSGYFYNADDSVKTHAVSIIQAVIQSNIRPNTHKTVHCTASIIDNRRLFAIAVSIVKIVNQLKYSYPA